MFKQLIFFSGVVGVCVGVALPLSAWADGLDARTHAKVMRAKREQALTEYERNRNPQAFAAANGQQQPNQQNAVSVGDPCAGVNIGNVMVDNGNRFGAPRENTVVVTGDVIVVPGRNCR